MTAPNPSTRIPIIDRAGRNLYAAALSGYMRGELNNLTVDDTFEDLADTEDDSLFDCGYYAWGHYNDLHAHPLRADRRTWDTLCRVCVFLATDLAHVREVGPSRWTRPNQLLAWAALAALIGCVVAGVMIHWAIGLIGWLFIGALWWVRTVRRSRREDPTRYNAAWPFADEHQWRRHADRLERFELPEWSPEFERRPVPVSMASWLVQTPMIVPVTVMLPLMLLWSARPQPEPAYRVVDLGEDTPGEPE